MTEGLMAATEQGPTVRGTENVLVGAIRTYLDQYDDPVVGLGAADIKRAQWHLRRLLEEVISREQGAVAPVIEVPATGERAAA